MSEAQQHAVPAVRVTGCSDALAIELQRGEESLWRDLRCDVPAVCVVSERDLGRLPHLVPDGWQIEHRGKRHKAKSLGQILGHKKGIYSIDGGYVKPGKALHGCRTFIRKSETRGGSALVFVSVAEELLDELRAAVGQTAPCSHGAPSGKRDELSWLDLSRTGTRCGDKLGQKFVGNAMRVEEVRCLIRMAAQSECPVLIQGETGTGKEIVAREIHALSARAKGAFVAVSCACFSDQTVLSEMFGHEKGAFTGAVRKKKGWWTLAHEGTFFLDEIGELSFEDQGKLLRALDSGEYHPVGSEKAIRSNARLVFATNRDLARMVREGRFRGDLFYRLSVICIMTPPLREHMEDLTTIADRLWKQIPARESCPLPRETEDVLKCHSWPGNVRELGNFLKTLDAGAPGKEVTGSMLRAGLRHHLEKTGFNIRDLR